MKYTCLVFADECAVEQAHAALAARVQKLRARRPALELVAMGAGAAVVHRGSLAAGAAEHVPGAAQLAALVVFDACDLDEALDVAAELGSGSVGIEVRPVQRPPERRGPRRVASAKVVPLHARH